MSNKPVWEMSADEQREHAKLVREEMEHDQTCRWRRTTSAECPYRETHHYCPHPEHACNCGGEKRLQP